MTEPTLILIGLIVVFALFFDFVNGFHDAANSIATIVATGVLKPLHAVMWAAFFNFAAVFVFDTDVAKTVGSGMINLNYVTLPVILAGLIGATAWGLITWWFKMPSSSSHALIGGYAGAAITHHGMHQGWINAQEVIITSGWSKVILFIILAPVIGLALGGTLMKLTKLLPKRSNKWFGRLQLLSSAFLSLTHGGNDAQKTAGILTGALVTAGAIDHFTIPHWVLFISYGTMALGTLAGGWRIVDTMGRQLTRLQPSSGFCAETAAASSILLATLLKLPVSTTHITTGAILGTGAAREIKAVRWNLAGRILMAWTITIPAAALLSGVMLLALQMLLAPQWIT